MLIHSEVLNNTEMLKLKIDMLAWIGMLPQSYVNKVRDKIKQLSQALAGPYIEKEDYDLLMAINENMNGGLEILLRQIPDHHTRACSHCVSNVLEVCTMLYEGSPIEYIRQKINDNWGDITAEDAPPSPLQVTAIPLPHGGGSAIEALIMGMMSSALRGHSDHPDNSDDRMNFPDSMVPISSLIRLLDNIIGTMPEEMHPEQGVNLARAGHEFDDQDIKDVNLQAFPMPDKEKLN